MEDIFAFETQCSNEERLIAQTVRQWVSKIPSKTWMDNFEQATFPLTWAKEMASLGLFGLTLPNHVGGAEASYVAYGLACQELERGDSGLRSFVSVQNSLCMHPIYAFGSEEQKNKYLPSMIAGETLGCFGLTEPDAGSDPGSMQTRATPVEGGWVLNGTKMWITNATVAQLGIIWAKINETDIRGFLVDLSTKGCTSKEMHHKWSLRASVTGELHFKDCFIPSSSLLPGTEKGLVSALECLTKARYGIAWGVTGAAMQCLDVALSYCQARQQFGKSLVSFQLIQKDLVTMWTEITKAQQLNLRVGRLLEEGKGTYAHVSMIKMNACQQALNIARMARNLLGANGISLEYPIARHLANLEAVFTYEGTDNMHHLILGHALTGVKAFG